MSEWKLLSRSEIADLEWNKTVVGANNEHIYGYTHYLDVVAKDWKGFVFGNYEAVMPVSLKSKFGVKYFGQINHVQRLIVFSVFDAVPSKEELERELLNSVNHIDMAVEQDLLANLERRERTNFILPLNLTADNLQKSFSTNTKRRIKKATHSDVVFSKVPKTTLNEAIKLFQNQKDYGLKNSWFEDLRSISNFDYSELYVVAVNGQKEAYAMVLHCETKVTLIFTALTENGKEIGAMHYLISELVRKYSNSNKVLDFEGSDDAGTARFYSSFGAKSEKYYYVQSGGILKRTKDLLKLK